MCEFIQVGVTALRDPMTGDFLPAVPLYIEKKDMDSGAVPEIDLYNIGKELGTKFKAYMDACRKEGVKVG